MAERKRQILINNLSNPRPELDGVYIEKAATDDGLTHKRIERCNPVRSHVSLSIRVIWCFQPFVGLLARFGIADGHGRGSTNNNAHPCLAMLPFFLHSPSKLLGSSLILLVGSMNKLLLNVESGLNLSKELALAWSSRLSQGYLTL